MIRMSETVRTVAHQMKEESEIDGSETKVETAIAIVRIHITFG